MPNSVSNGSTLEMPGMNRNWRQFQDASIRRFFQFNGVLSILILLGIFLTLFKDGLPALRELGFGSFIRMTWNPTSFVLETYGLGAMIISTLMVTFLALLFAVPIGLGVRRLSFGGGPQLAVREILKPVIEILAGIPSVVVGFLGIVLIGPWIARVFHLPNGLNALNGAILLAVMALPTIISISEDAISSVPRAYNEASLALGASQWQTLIRVVVPVGPIGDHRLGHAGHGPGHRRNHDRPHGHRQCLNPDPYSGSRADHDGHHRHRAGRSALLHEHYYALFVIGFVLFVMTFLVNLVADIVLSKYQEVER